MNLIKINPVALLRSFAFAIRENGSIAMEFALTLPIWIALLLGTSDTAHLLIMSQRVDRVTYSISDIITQQNSVTISDLNNTCLAAEQLMLPFPFGARGKVIITSTFKEAGHDIRIVWQHINDACGTLHRDSRVGAIGDTMTTVNGLTLNDNDNVIITETFYDYHPLFPGIGIFTAHDLYRATYYKPRLSPLITPPS